MMTTYYDTHDIVNPFDPERTLVTEGETVIVVQDDGRQCHYFGVGDRWVRLVPEDEAVKSLFEEMQSSMERLERLLRRRSLL